VDRAGNQGRDLDQSRGAVGGLRLSTLLQQILAGKTGEGKERNEAHDRDPRPDGQVGEPPHDCGHRLKPQQVILRTLFDAEFKPGISTGRGFGSSDRAHYC
jgi:hypothetical protein